MSLARDASLRTTCVVHFPASGHPSLRFPAGTVLSEQLTVANSPVLFGCRTGVCGTCLARVQGRVPPPGAEEREVVEVLARGVRDARLVCQVELTGDVEIEPLPLP